MGNDKKTNTKNTTGDKIAKAGKPADTTQSKATTGATDADAQENQNQEGKNNSGQTTDTKPASLDNQSENSADGAQGGIVDSEVNLTIEQVNTSANPEVIKEIVNNALKEALNEISEAQAVVTPTESKENTEKRKRIANDVFQKNSGFTKVFFTSDFLPFGNENDARKHAVTLKDTTVTPINKED